MKTIQNFRERLNDEIYRKKSISNLGSIGYKIFRFILLGAMCFVILYPIIYMISVSFRESVDLYDPTVIWIPRHFTLDNFAFVMDLIDYWPLFGNSIYFSVVATLLSVVACSLAGYGFARFQFKLKGPLFMWMLFTIIVPPQITAIPMYLQYSEFDFFGISLLLELITGKELSVNLLNTPLTLFIPAIVGCGINSGFLIYMFRQFFRNMPTALEDAAYIDGYGPFRTFVKIIVPNASGSFLVATLLSFVWYYNDYYFTSMYFSKAPTLSVGLAGLTDSLKMMVESATEGDPYAIITQLQAGCLLVIVPVFVLFLFLQKNFIKSVEQSGIVG